MKRCELQLEILALFDKKVVSVEVIGELTADSLTVDEIKVF